MPFTPPPQNPNFTFNSGRIVLDRYDFEAHLEGTNPPGFSNFRHTADQLDMNPVISFNAGSPTTVQAAIKLLSEATATTMANNSTPGVIQLSGDIGGTATDLTVTGLQGTPISTSFSSETPPTTNYSLTWNGSAWVPQASFVIGINFGIANSFAAGSVSGPYTGILNGYGTGGAPSIYAQCNTFSGGLTATMNLVNSDGTGIFAYFQNNGFNIGNIALVSGAVVYNTSSDIRLKENIKDTTLGLIVLEKIQVKDFNIIGHDKKQQGFIAQQLYKHYPLAVTKGGKNVKINPWSVDYSKLTPLLVKSTQELSEKEKVLENKLNKLSNEVAKLKASLKNTNNK